MKKRLTLVFLFFLILINSFACKKKTTNDLEVVNIINEVPKKRIDSLNNCTYDQASDLIFLIPEVKALDRNLRLMTRDKRGVAILDNDSSKENSEFYEMKVGENEEFRFQTYYRFMVEKSTCNIYFMSEDNQKYTLLEWSKTNKIKKYYENKSDSIKYQEYLKTHYIGINENNFGTNSTTLTLINLPIDSKSIQSKLYKIITKSNFLIEYNCGEEDIMGGYLGDINGFNLYIIENYCGDFPFKNLLVVKNNVLISKLLIDVESWDVEKKETENIEDQTNITFEIEKNYIITIKTEKQLDKNIQSIKKENLLKFKLKNNLVSF